VDSITQAALGAAVAEAGLGRRLGNKAILWGAVLGTLPDLDILAYPFLDEASRIVWHRGWSHSLLTAALASVPVGLLIGRIHGPVYKIGWLALVVFLIFATHALIDCFNVYGTQILWPFSREPVGFHMMFVVDPLYTLPLLIGLWFASRRPAGDRLRARTNAAGLMISTLYAGWGFLAHGWATDQFHKSLAAEGIEVKRVLVAPAPFQTFVWRAVAEDLEGNFLMTHAPILSGRKTLDWEPRKRGEELLLGLEASRAVQTLIWFSRGFYSVQELDGRLYFADLRFSRLPGSPEERPSVFTWEILPATESHEVEIRPVR